jgi:hypothetical protein
MTTTDQQQAVTEAAPFDSWAKLDLFGRQTAAGRVREVKIAGQDFLRLYIPAQDGKQARTIDYNPAAVYSIEHVDEETARAAARLDQPPLPVEAWSARRLLGVGTSQLALGASDTDGDEEGDEVEFDDEAAYR